MEKTCQVNNFLIRLKMNVFKGVKSKVFLWQEQIVETKNLKALIFILFFMDQKNN